MQTQPHAAVVALRAPSQEASREGCRSLRAPVFPAQKGAEVGVSTIGESCFGLVV